MGRTLSTDLQDILAMQHRDVQKTVTITFPGDETVFRFATRPLVISAETYVNDLESVREIRYNLDAPTDRVGVAIQNKDRVLGLHVANNPDLWRKAEAVIGRWYQGGALTEWTGMFQGAVQQPFVDDNTYQVTFDIVPDTMTPGAIICTRTLAPQCPFLYKDPKTCASESAREVCNHLLRSIGGCEGDENDHHFGGMEHRQDPDQRAPGEPGGPPGGGGDEPPGGYEAPSPDWPSRWEILQY